MAPLFMLNGKMEILEILVAAGGFITLNITPGGQEEQEGGGRSGDPPPQYPAAPIQCLLSLFIQHLPAFLPIVLHHCYCCCCCLAGNRIIYSLYYMYTAGLNKL